MKTRTSTHMKGNLEHKFSLIDAQFSKSIGMPQK